MKLHDEFHYIIIFVINLVWSDMALWRITGPIKRWVSSRYRRLFFFVSIRISIFPVTVNGRCPGWPIPPSFLDCVYIIYCWTCFRPEYNWNTVRWTNSQILYISFACDYRIIYLYYRHSGRTWCDVCKSVQNMVKILT